MKLEFNHEEATEIIEAALRAAVPVPAGYKITSVQRTGSYTNVTVVTLEKIAPSEPMTGKEDAELA